MEGLFFSSPSVTTASLMVQLISQPSLVVITEIPRALFSGGLPDHFHRAHNECLPASQFSPPSLSQRCRAPRVSGVLFFCPRFGSSGWLSQRNQPDPHLFPGPHMSECTSMLGSFQEDRRDREEPDGTQWSETSCSDK